MKASPPVCSNVECRSFCLLEKSELLFHFSSFFVCFAQANSNYWGGAGRGIKINCFGKLLTMMSRSDLITFHGALKLFKTKFYFIMRQVCTVKTDRLK